MFFCTSGIFRFFWSIHLPNSIPTFSDLHGHCEKVCVGLTVSFLRLYQKCHVLATLGELESPNGLSYFISLQVKTTDYILLSKNFLQLYSSPIQCTHRTKTLSNVYSSSIFYLFFSNVFLSSF